MSTLKRILAVVALCLAVGVLASVATATDQEKNLYDRSKLTSSTGTAVLNTTTATLTAWSTLITITPQPEHAMFDVVVVLDLAKATTGFAAGYTSETISFSVARAVDGTNYRTANNLATAAVSGTNSGGLSIEINLGPINPTEAAKVMVKLSAESANNASIPYVVYYRAGARATVTPAS